ARKALRRSTAAPVETAAPPCPDAMEWGEVRRVLDEELGRLPDQWRAPLVLCYLDGLTRAAAAKRLGWSLRTLHRRLDEGRERLRTRLVRRGLAPALLATTVFADAGARAVVPPLLARETFARGVGESAVPPAVQALVFRPVAKGGMAMYVAMSLVVIAGGLGLAVGSRPDRRPGEVDPGEFVLAPVPKPRPPVDPLDGRIKEVRKKAIAYLLKEQTAAGHWETRAAPGPTEGGVTALALLALMENGIGPREDAVANGLKYLRTLKPTGTYVVSLQTQALCRANQKKDAERIKANVAWLEKAAGRDGKGRLVGWSYTDQPGGRGDNSNTRYAVAALYAAHDAGFKVEGKGFWADVQNLFVRTQRPTGGWGYMEFGATETHTMTFSGLVCLAASARTAGKWEDAAAEVRKRGEQWVAERFKVEQTNTYYNLDVIANYARLAELACFGAADRKRDWFRDGLELLEKRQQVDGRFKQDASDLTPIVSTSFALRFLASRLLEIAAPTAPLEPIHSDPPPKKKSPDDLLAEKVQETAKKAVAFLKDKQAKRDDKTFNWEDNLIAVLQEGGQSSLVLLALLESGVKPDDPVVARGLQYLRSLPPQHVYVVSLQTQALCKANQKDDAKLIEKNVAWLEGAAVRNRAGQLLGWSYKSGDKNSPDNSNTRYAISGLFAAHQAGSRVKGPTFWQDVRALYLGGQTGVGSWNYRTGDRAGKGTLTMTQAGVLSLRQAREVIGDDHRATDAAIKVGEDWMAKEFKFVSPPHTFYNFDLIAATGRQSGQRFVAADRRKIDWYREGCEWLFANQKANGSFKLNDNLDQFELISTSFALRFLASRPAAE
ncbi:MAG TPA: sigma factor-like helix-turn-helix DNA-binding protein, partial [Gemmataceae bacterium]|nr:sigma factor-like helix-turn-helix DNA-binding protein [Gemmataceae bacterium]